MHCVKRVCAMANSLRTGGPRDVFGPSTNRGGDDWMLSTVEEGDDDEDDDDDSDGGCRWLGCFGARSRRCCRGAAALCCGLFGRQGTGVPDSWRILRLRETVRLTTSAMSAPFLHMSAYLVRRPRRAAPFQKF